METKRIVRSRTERIAGGVAGGIAQYTNVDPLFVRIAFVVLSLLPFTAGLGVLIYLTLWVLLPIEGTLASDGRAQVRENVEDIRATAERSVDQLRRMFQA